MTKTVTDHQLYVLKRFHSAFTVGRVYAQLGLENKRCPYDKKEVLKREWFNDGYEQASNPIYADRNGVLLINKEPTEIGG